MSAPQLPWLSPNRLAALTDGVFAIALTLLVLNLNVPRIPEAVASRQLPHQLVLLWPKFLSYGLSFVVIGVYWVGQHNQFHYVRRVDRPFMWLNLLFLLWVSFIPFSAALLGEYVHVRLAVAFYGLNLVLVGLTLYAIWRYATTADRLVDADLPPHLIRTAGRRVLLGVWLYLLAVVAAIISPWLSVGLYVLVPVLYIMPGQVDRHFSRRLTAPRPHAPGSETDPDPDPDRNTAG